MTGSAPAPWISHRVLVTVGTGGVGKTTIAAALGLLGAAAGKRALVITIDPARRLADALGIPLDHEIREVPLSRLAPGGGPVSGALFASMLDTKRTFDELVRRHAPDAEAIERIFANPIYQNLTDALAGSREYSAMEQLHALFASGRFDLIVLDTPPASHALDFLDAPRRLTGFLESQMLRVLLRPALAVGRRGFRLFRSSSDLILRVVERITGLEFLRAVSEFLFAFESMLDGFLGRAADVERLLRDERTGFVLVIGSDPVQIRRAQEFWTRLSGEGIRLVGGVQNRVRVWPDGEQPPAHDADAVAEASRALSKVLAESGAASAESLATELVAGAARYASLASLDLELGRELGRMLPLAEHDLRRIPLLPGDVDTISGLWRIARALEA